VGQRRGDPGSASRPAARPYCPAVGAGWRGGRLGGRRGRTVADAGRGHRRSGGCPIPHPEPAARCPLRDDRRRVHRRNFDRAGDSAARIMVAGYSTGDRVQRGRLGRTDRSGPATLCHSPNPERRQFCHDDRIAALRPARRTGPLAARPTRSHPAWATAPACWLAQLRSSGQPGVAQARTLNITSVLALQASSMSPWKKFAPNWPSNVEYLDSIGREIPRVGWPQQQPMAGPVVAVVASRPGRAWSGSRSCPSARLTEVRRYCPGRYERLSLSTSVSPARSTHWRALTTCTPTTPNSTDAMSCVGAGLRPANSSHPIRWVTSLRANSVLHAAAKGEQAGCGSSAYSMTAGLRRRGRQRRSGRAGLSG
jgi:hypothetical protein